MPPIRIMKSASYVTTSPKDQGLLHFSKFAAPFFQSKPYAIIEWDEDSAWVIVTPIDERVEGASKVTYQKGEYPRIAATLLFQLGILQHGKRYEVRQDGGKILIMVNKTIKRRIRNMEYGR